MADDEYLPLPGGFDRVLVVVAHPDDMEFGGAGAVARWTSEGTQVAYLLVTRGEAGIDTMSPDECAVVREAEQRAACAAVGVRDCEFLDHPDGIVEYSVALRRDIAAAIRRHRPQLVVTSNHREFWDAEGIHLNQADHIAVGRAVIDAVRDAANRWIFRDVGEKWDGVQGIALAGSPRSRHAVDISGHLDAAVDSLKAHERYLAALSGEMADADTFLRRSAEEAATRLPGASAAAIFEWLGP
ncbi:MULTISPECIES: PIG-L deacetylase family protein [Pseudonocardia]|uniref:Mycothiol S-conjugate amidase n=2 Tax=Pseudonocardia TaxID=1847 RepID=A0A1Y2NAG2_PSEAH|nr:MULTISPECIES: PIG-L deacetylase family protein [Pseudonocardia]OSY44221.1 Mycothiol S-conjugate amidase [Pseudonocardia autotrophica]TDN74049.1 LmbE family N-acetylglucosaminyl deacetylase [Pseudonocardia autotrophica]BBG04806.1 GlcNAc-PI de-N-acetylase [Pseudonocardia autotrophica]GEC23462.1 GlcNAc-PI de-N-acetylase [Pseudonocardia saturnea]